MIGPYIRLYISSTCGELTDGGGAQAARETAKSATRTRPTSRRRREARRMACLPFQACGHREGRYGRRPNSTRAPVTQESVNARDRCLEHGVKLAVSARSNRLPAIDPRLPLSLDTQSASEAVYERLRVLDRENRRRLP